MLSYNGQRPGEVRRVPPPRRTCNTALNTASFWSLMESRYTWEGAREGESKGGGERSLQ